ncbi:MAG: cupin domain-containing protein [Propionibacteriaceae bacterium]|jgi:mannose-6-phosphate isomerase-like protein (cupin superfamily)|nr:cupin domain-containing protein [Propionibacteriaceae bacterium]
MEKNNAKLADYRFGDWGPGYLICDDSSDLGAFRLRPGDAMANHFHERCHETFVVLEGKCSVWVDEQRRVVLGANDVARCGPGEHHYVVNDFDEPFLGVFIKSPSSPGDTVNVPWVPQ